MFRNGFIYLLILVALAALFFNVFQQPRQPNPIPISKAAQDVQLGNVKKISASGTLLTLTYKDGVTATTTKANRDVSIEETLKNLGVPPDKISAVDIVYEQASQWGDVLTLLTGFLPLIFVGALFFFLMRQAQSGNNQALSFGKSRARMFSGDKPTVTFADVAGVDEAKAELQEVVEFLKEPDKFTALGARIPKGVLLVGPPGTGKTLMARAVAGEANVPFFSISGSEFVEMFVGVGASVTGDTPILIKTADGTRLTTIGEFVDSYYKGNAEGYVVNTEGVQTLGFVEKESKFKGSPKRFFGHSQWVNVRGVYRHRVTEICEIHYLGGVIRTTGDHSVFVRTREGVHLKAARDLKRGDVLVALPLKVRGEYSPEDGTPHSIRAHIFEDAAEPVGLPVWDDDPQMLAPYAFALEQQGSMSQAAIGRELGVSQATVGHWQRGLHIPRPLTRNLVKQALPENVPVTPALLTLFGYYTAEGRATPHLEFTFGIHEKTLHEDCIALMRKVFNVELTLSSTEDNTLRIGYPRPLGRFFARYCGEGSRHKHIPEMLWHLPREYFFAYLNGYAHGDGYTTQEGKLSMTSVSQQLIRELTWLCAMHGIEAGVREVEVEGGRIIKDKPLPDGKAWNLVIGKTSHPFAPTEILHAAQGKKPYVREVIVKPYDGYVYDLCGCDNEAFFGGEKPVLLHNSRVRDLFDQAKRNSPCIVFVDEIDAVGRHRGAGLGGSHDEREQTLNQILVEMDGFDTDTKVIIVAATNRPDILDPALLRPGRFDRRVVLDRPDMNGRKQILQVHTKGKPVAEDVDYGVIAKQTPGFSGADIENLVNEAAILAARRNKKAIGMPELQESIEKVIAGPERKSRLISEEEKRIVAYHEAGHALVMRMLPNCDPVRKISIISRGMALGYTINLPEDDRYLQRRSKFMDDLAGMLGGRAAEEIVFNDVTTGAANDLERATDLARAMVTRYGMSEKLGPRTFGDREELIFLGREIAEQRNYSEQVAQQIDEEVKRIIGTAFAQAKETLTTYREKLDAIANRLIQEETIEGAEFDALFGEVAPARSTPASTPSKQPAPRDEPAEAPKRRPVRAPAPA